MGALQWPRPAVATVAATDPATTSSARSAAASSGGGRRSTQAGEYAPEARPTSRQHQLQPPKQAAPALHSARSAHWIYVKTFMTGLAIYRPSSSKDARATRGSCQSRPIDRSQQIIVTTRPTLPGTHGWAAVKLAR